jgi:nitrous oxidase accessory protein
MTILWRTALAAGLLTAAGSWPAGPPASRPVAAERRESTPAAGAGDAAWLQRQLASTGPDGTVDVPAGEYRGHFVIDRPIHVRAIGRAILRGDGTGNVLEVHAADVIIDGLEIRGSGMDLTRDQAGIHVTGARVVIRRTRISDSLHGIYVRHADGARLEDNEIVGRLDGAPAPSADPGQPGPGGTEACAIPADQNARGNGIHIWNSRGHTIARNVIRGTRDGIYFSFVDDSDVADNVVTNVRYGLHYMYSDGNRFHGNLFQDDAAGAALMYSKHIVLDGNRFEHNRGPRAYGLLMQGVDDTRVAGNRIAGNTVGIFVENSHGNQVRDNVMSRNHVGLHVSDSSDGNVFAGNAFAGNVHAVETSGANTANRWADDGRGNYWDEAARWDLDGDGVGDLPHRALDLFGPLRRELPAVGLLAGSPGERLLRFVHARIALPGLAAIVDPAPLVRENRP